MNRYLLPTLAMLALLCACSGAQKPAGRLEDVIEARAEVTAVDPSRRLLTLKARDGREVVVEVPEEAKNLDQVAVGDEVVVAYTEAPAWQVRPAGQGGPGVSGSGEVSAAAPGEKPAVQGKRTLALTASITEIDLNEGTVTLVGPEGRTRTFKARDPSNLRKVKVGDLVDITYTEALAVAVKPVKK